MSMLPVVSSYTNGLASIGLMTTVLASGDSFDILNPPSGPFPIQTHRLSSVSIDDVDYAIEDASRHPALHQAFAQFFGERVTIQDLINAFEGMNISLKLDCLRVARHNENTFETHAEFKGNGDSINGSCTYVWQRNADGSLTRRSDTSIEITGSKSRLALQIHQNLLHFARKSGMVSDFQIEAREVGRYAYRFFDGVTIDQGTRNAIGNKLKEFAGDYGEAFAQDKYNELRSPRELAGFIVLPRIKLGWLRVVSEIIERHGYQFTVDQVVDVARRPGLAFLLDRSSYTMQLDLKDDETISRFRESVIAGRGGRILRRVRGVLGMPFTNLPETVRNALIIYRPHLFPRPRQTPPIPDLSQRTQPRSPYHVVGFRTQDSRLLRSIDRDPSDKSLRDYRASEVDQVVSAIEDGVQLVSSTGLSGSGKSEVLIWNLERVLSERGHRVVSLDAQAMGGGDRAIGLIREIDDIVQPTVFIFDESVYISGKYVEKFAEFAKRFLRYPGQHIIFVGGGVTSPQKQRSQIESHLHELWNIYQTAHVSLYPKPLNLRQAFRFLGLARLEWLSDDDKMELLDYVLERYPPYFIPLIPIRFHEHPEITTLAGARLLVDAEIDVDYWTAAARMVIQDPNGEG